MAIVMTKKFDDCTVYIDDEYSRNTSPEEKSYVVGCSRPPDDVINFIVKLSIVF